MKRREWQAVRARVIREGNFVCANRCRRTSGILDVVPIGVTRGYVALCRSCRLKRGGRARGLKAAATRRARAAQLKLPKGRAA